MVIGTKVYVKFVLQLCKISAYSILYIDSTCYSIYNFLENILSSTFIRVVSYRSLSEKSEKCLRCDILFYIFILIFSVCLSFFLLLLEEKTDKHANLMQSLKSSYSILITVQLRYIFTKLANM